MNRIAWLLLVLGSVPTESFADETFSTVFQLTPISAAEEWEALGSVAAIEAWVDSELARTPAANRRSDLLATKAYLRAVAKDRAQAKTLAEEAVAASPDNPRSLVFAAWLRSTEPALARLEAISDESGWAEQARLVRAGQLLDQGKLLEANALINQHATTMVYANLMRAHFASKEGKAGDELGHIEQYFKHWHFGTLTNKYLPHFLKSDALLKLKRFREAEQVCSDAMTSGADFLPLKLNLVKSYCELDKGDLALRAAKEMERQDASSTVSTVALAEAYVELEMWPEALPCLRIMHQEEPGHVLTAWRLWHACLIAGNCDEAVRCLAKNQEVNPDAKFMLYFGYLSAVCQAHALAVTAENKDKLTSIITAVLEHDGGIVRDRLWAIAALNNLGQREAAQRFVSAIEKAKCDAYEAALLEHVTKAIETNTQLHPQQSNQ